MSPHTIIVTRIHDGCTRKFESHAALSGTKDAAALLAGEGLRVSIVTNRGTRWRLVSNSRSEDRWRHDTGRMG